MHCDFVVASDDARFRMSLAQIGLAPSWFLAKKLLEVAGAGWRWDGEWRLVFNLGAGSGSIRLDRVLECVLITLNDQAMTFTR